MNRAKQHANYKDEWETPPELMEAIVKRWGPMDLDVAASAKNAKAPLFFTKEDSAMAHLWNEYNVWMNPPYGRGVGAWISKADHEIRRGRAHRVVALLPANTSAKWFALAVACATEVVFLAGRVSFLLDGVPQKGNTGGSVVIVFSRRDNPQPWGLWAWRK